MGKPKHTPGPWYADVRQAPQVSYIYTSDGATDDDIIVETSPECQISDADAALIAAAPDMLEVLEVFSDESLEWNAEVIDNFCRAARIVLAKARGGATE